VFDAGAIRISRIREENEYGGLRMRAAADIAGGRMVVNDEDSSAQVRYFPLRRRALPQEGVGTAIPALG